MVCLSEYQRNYGIKEQCARFTQSIRWNDLMLHVYFLRLIDVCVSVCVCVCVFECMSVCVLAGENTVINPFSLSVY